MIYTVTFNPALDYTISMDKFEYGMTNRSTSENIFVGGKGINVSLVLENLGIDSTALGFTAGFTGEEIIRRLEEKGIKNGFIMLDEGVSRINLKLTNVDGTEINASGPAISHNKLDLLMDKLKHLSEGDILFLSGSIPASVDDDIYQKIMEMLEGRGVTIVVDATKDLLMNVLKYKPFLIKPNNHEIGEIYGVKLDTREKVIPYAKKMQEAGAQNVLVSMAEKGAVLIAADGSIYETDAPEGTLINAVGAGDSMVAGFMAGWLDKKNYLDAFKLGVAAGSATAFSEGLATKDKIESVLALVNL